MRISAAVITYNAAEALDRCLASLAFADEIIVLDQGSTDHTTEVCTRHGASLHQTAWLGFGPTKAKAVALCRNDWVLSVDSDEEVTPELAAAIAALPERPAVAAYAVNRLSCFLGSWIRHAGWHPDWIVRLFDRTRGGFDRKLVHEAVRVEGPVVRLPGILRHYAYDSMEQFISKLDRYTSIAARELHGQGRRATPWGAIVRSQATFWRMWILKGGIIDGAPGTLLCLVYSFYVLSKYTKLWLLGRT